MAAAAASPRTFTTFDALYTQLLTLSPPLLPPGHSADPALTAQIAALLLHPTLETALHILNADLPSAHFLVRHMQAAPMFEGMYLHGILHRIEGDYDNARAWYGNVCESEVFRENWGSKEEALDFIGRVERLRKKKVGDREALGKESVEEIKKVVGFCVAKFGTERVEDASAAWKQSEEHRKMGQDMVTGGEGFRNF
ncbi:hypothetical protein MMC19_001878 [Ptychographa xylographoides]|nr:hypothetical protein [Ptychographa xylographoides]